MQVTDAQCRSLQLFLQMWKVFYEIKPLCREKVVILQYKIL